MPAFFIAAFTPSATISTMRGRPMSSGWSSALIAVPITRRALSAVPFRSFRAKTVACGVMTPSQPPDHTIGIVATSASPRLPCFNSTRRKAWSASRRVKSLTPPLPSVLPTTATTWSAVNWPARMRSSRPEASCTLLSSTFATSTAIVSVSSCGAARSERSGRDPDPVFDGEVDAQDRADLIAAAPVRDGRARVAGDHAALADVGLDVLVAEREVVPARVANLVGEDRRRAIRPLPRLVEEAVGHRQVPASVVAPGNVRERLEPRLVLLHRPAPDDGVELGEVDDLAVQPADHADVAEPGREIVAIVDRVRVERIVVPGQDDDRLSEPRELGAHEVDGLVGHAVVIEQVAGDQHEIGAVAQRAIDDARQDAPDPRLVRGLLARVAVAVALEVDVGGVQHSQGASRGGHGSSRTSGPAFAISTSSRTRACARRATARGSPAAGSPRSPDPTAGPSRARAGAPSCSSGAEGNGSRCTATSRSCRRSPRRPTGGCRPTPRARERRPGAPGAPRGSGDPRRDGQRPERPRRDPRPAVHRGAGAHRRLRRA